ncbi:PO21 protein, partial [Sterrhoptilus dennistouni]|nr:PO21 protein [Sterrhoptilus dennistouni]
KAFDTVSHRHIIVGLTQRGVDPHVVHLVSEMYRGITTYIVTRDWKTDPININSGVKQGDLMSPLLLNLALGPLLCKLEVEGKGFHHVMAMAFADDLVLVSNSWEGMCHNIKVLETFCDLAGLRTQGEK